VELILESYQSNQTKVNVAEVRFLKKIDGKQK